MTEPTEEPMAPLLRSFGADSGVQRFLVRALQEMRDRAEDDRLSVAADDVLSGRRSLYNLFADDRFTEAARGPIEQGMTEVLELDEDELQRLAEEGRQSVLEEDGRPPEPENS